MRLTNIVHIRRTETSWQDLPALRFSQLQAWAGIRRGRAAPPGIILR
jgi:hypothetical protein